MGAACGADSSLFIGLVVGGCLKLDKDADDLGFVFQFLSPLPIGWLY